MSGFYLLGTVLFLEVSLQGVWIRFLLKRHVSQNLKKYGPQSHIEKKKGTPTMGGVVFLVIGVLLCSFLWMTGSWTGGDALAVLGFPLAGGLIGLADDLLKYIRSSSEGLRSLQKLFLQLAAGSIWAGIYMADGKFGVAPGVFWGGIWGYLALVFILVGALNAVNITDGLDGLASGSCAISFLGFLVLAPGNTASSAGALIGLGLSLGFLRHNLHPARVFMGDCGSHFLGGLLVSICVSGDLAILILPLGFLMGIEVVSVIIQIAAIRGFGRKVFRMSPIHHHFEMIGWSENRVVVSFWAFHLAGMILLSTLIVILLP
ncbi:MAG: phospho-N-acetylmuramoyl-pentapeptide-transferase [Thermovirgaceae bacterium]|nr:phospho-N-acetylmuramoyl-pentapeptide-transferase [Thermovirgaceae bacterium]